MKIRMIGAAASFLFSFSLTANAQFSVVETDGRNKLNLLGREFNMNLFNLASAETDKFNNEGGRIATYSFLTLASWAGDYRVAARIPFQYNTAGTDRFGGSKVNKQEFALQDIILGVQRTNFVFLPYDWELYWEGRIYLPTSSQSRKTGQIARLRNDLILSRVFSRYFETEYASKFSYYVQSRTAYANSFVDEDGFEVNNIASATKRMELDHWISLWGKITPRTGIGWMLGAEDQYWNKSEANRREKPAQYEWKTGPQIRFPFGESANFHLLLLGQGESRHQSGGIRPLPGEEHSVRAIEFREVLSSITIQRLKHEVEKPKQPIRSFPDYRDIVPRSEADFSTWNGSP
ncbi:MAG: hypothetical protein HC902_09230 [Calothrix sp. SM1_5_4]|nr:hypothetical protein [Calothrix sp. SM1_5_4]